MGGWPRQTPFLNSGYGMGIFANTVLQHHAGSDLESLLQLNMMGFQKLASTVHKPPFHALVSLRVRVQVVIDCDVIPTKTSGSYHFLQGHAFLNLAFLTGLAPVS
jgi:hypothetical protein